MNTWVHHYAVSQILSLYTHTHHSHWAKPSCWITQFPHFDKLLKPRREMGREERRGYGCCNLGASVSYTEKFISLVFTEQISEEKRDNTTAFSTPYGWQKFYRFDDPKLQTLSVFPGYLSWKVAALTHISTESYILVALIYLSFKLIRALNE